VSASGRLRDLERAISDLNAKAAGSAAGAEEIKSQLLNAGRKLKAQQDTIEQLRDQLDRLNSQVLQSRSAPLPAEQAGEPAPEPAPKVKP
jgi:chromosome segregation ATPase